MPKIHVNVIDMAGHQTVLPLPNDKPIYDIIPAIVTLLDLQQSDTEEQMLHYRLFSPRLQRVLAMNGTLYSNGVLNDDTLRIAPAPSSINLELELLDDPSPGARLYLPNKTSITIGRGSQNDIVVRHAAISRKHGELIWQNDLHIYRDLNSANGSYINGQVVTEPMPISPGSILNLSESVRLVYQETSDEVPDDDAEANVVEGRALDSAVVTSLNPLPRGIVFVSYDENELPLVKSLVAHLRDANIQVFWDQEIPPGSNATEALATGLNLADVMIAILTTEAVANHALLDQWHEFMLARKPIVPVIYSPCDIPDILQNYPTVEFHGDFKRLNNDIIHALLRAMR